MWCIEAKAKVDIPLGMDVSEWTNEQFKKFIESKRTSCNQFTKAFEWLGKRNYKEAVRDCNEQSWIEWLNKKCPKGGVIKTGNIITITHGRNEKYALWHHSGIWDLPEEYVG